MGEERRRMKSKGTVKRGRGKRRAVVRGGEYKRR